MFCFFLHFNKTGTTKIYTKIFIKHLNSNIQAILKINMTDHFIQSSARNLLFDDKTIEFV